MNKLTRVRVNKSGISTLLGKENSIRLSCFLKGFAQLGRIATRRFQILNPTMEVSFAIISIEPPNLQLGSHVQIPPKAVIDVFIIRGNFN